MYSTGKHVQHPVINHNGKEYVCVCVCVCARACAHIYANHFSCVRLFVTLWTMELPGPSSHGIFQGRILEWVAMPSSHVSS